MMDWNEWIRELISCFRSEVEKLQPNQKLGISPIYDLSFPCQVDIIWFQNSQFGFDFQIMIFQHVQDRKDLEIHVHGPIAFHNALDTLEQVLANETWSRELVKEEFNLIEHEDRTMRTIMEDVFVETYKELQAYVISASFAESPRIAGINRKKYLTNDCFYWRAEGNIRATKPKEIAASIVEDAIKDISRAQAQSQIEAQPPPKDDLQAYGTYFYPAIWVEKMPKRTFRQKAKGQLFRKLAEKSFHLEYKGFQTVVREDGLVAIVTNSKEKALEMINEIMGAALVFGLPCLAVSEPEIADIKIETMTSAIRGWSMSFVSDRMRLHLEPMGPYSDFLIHSRNIISQKDVENLFKNAEIITSNAETAKSLVFLLQSFTHLYSFEYPQCFVMGWTVIERHIHSVWKDFLNQQRVTGDRLKKLTKGMWTTDDILETLNLFGIISAKRYKEFQKLKRKRNHILHEGGTATKDDAIYCFATASIIVVDDSSQNLGKPYVISPQLRRRGLR